MKKFAMVICYQSSEGPAFDHVIGLFDSEDDAYNSGVMEALEDVVMQNNGRSCLINNYVFEI